jgi:hypothetical protein
MKIHTTIALSLLTVGLLTGSSTAQQKSAKEQIAGAWTVVSTYQTAPDGTKHQLFGPNPKGILVLDRSGAYVQIIVRPGREKFKANNRLKGTPEENTAAVHGTTAAFGTWSIDQTGKLLTVKIESGMYPNQDGSVSTRTISVNGDELRIINPSTASGMKAENVWRRIK